MQIYLIDRRPRFLTIQMSQELPRFVFSRMDFTCETNPFADSFPDKFMDFDKLAERVVAVNATLFELESDDLFETYRGFLVDVTEVNGVENILSQTRYSLSMGVALGFQQEQVAYDVGCCLQRAFYPDAEVLITQGPEQHHAAYREDFVPRPWN
ncbi:MAG: hypothetical protein VB817_06550 [Pirellulaceae bacterium]